MSGSTIILVVVVIILSSICDAIIVKSVRNLNDRVDRIESLLDHLYNALDDDNK